MITEHLANLKSMITMEEDDVEVVIKVGWITIARLVEEDGRWFPTIPSVKEISTMGFKTKELAFDGLLHYLKID